jgi:hypothetical protein
MPPVHLSTRKSSSYDWHLLINVAILEPCNILPRLVILIDRIYRYINVYTNEQEKLWLVYDDSSIMLHHFRLSTKKICNNTGCTFLSHLSSINVVYLLEIVIRSLILDHFCTLNCHVNVRQEYTKLTIELKRQWWVGAILIVGLKLTLEKKT